MANQLVLWASIAICWPLAIYLFLQWDLLSLHKQESDQDYEAAKAEAKFRK